MADNDNMNEAELTLLSLLAEAERFDHELNALIDARGIRAWVNVGMSSLIYLLNKLERQAMIESMLRPDTSGIARKVYRITDAGRAVLQTAVAELLRQPRGLGDGFELGLANLHVLKPRRVFQMLTHHRADLDYRLKLIEDALKVDNFASEGVRAMYSHSAALIRAERDWLDGFIAHWLETHPAAAHSDPDSPTDPHSRRTQVHRPTTPPIAKQRQQLKKPKPNDE